jgi:hypothetical protein
MLAKSLRRMGVTSDLAYLAGLLSIGPASPPGRWLGATPILVMPSGSASSSGCGRPPSSSSATRSSKKRRRHSGLPAERTKGPSR